LGSKIAELRGHSSVCDKVTAYNVCCKVRLPYGFDGPMHSFGMHVDAYSQSRSDPVHYSGTKDLLLEISEFTCLCLPVLKQRFHSEYVAMQ